LSEYRIGWFRVFYMAIGDDKTVCVLDLDDRNDARRD